MTKDERLAIVDRDKQSRVWDEVGGQIEQWFLEDGLRELESLQRFDGFRDTKTFPFIEQRNESAVHTTTVEVLAIMPMYHTLIRKGRIDSYWQDDINRLENNQVLGWRYRKE